MTNPAHGLAQIFQAWDFSSSDKFPSQLRAEYARRQGMSEDAVVRLGMRHLLDIETRIRDLDALGVDITPYNGLVPVWQTNFIKATQLPNPKQRGTRLAPALSNELLRLLRSLGSTIESQAMALAPTPSSVAAIESAITDAEEFVRDVDLAEETRHYILGLLARIRTALREGRPAEFRSAFNEYVGATVIQEKAAEGEAKGRWAWARDHLAAPMIAGASGNALGQAAIMAIGLLGQ